MQELSRPLLILFRGYPGTGKSHLAAQLSDYLGFPLIVRDKYKTLLRKQSYPEDQLGKESYALMWRQADNYLAEQRACICDTSLVQPTGLDDIESLRKKYLADVVVVECVCLDELEHARRLEGRSLHPEYYAVNSLAKYKQFVVANKSYEDIRFPYTTIRIDTAKQYSVRDIANTILEIGQSGKNEIVSYNL